MGPFREPSILQEENGSVLHEQHLRQDSLQGNRTEMKFMKRQVAMKGPVLKPALNSPSPV